MACVKHFALNSMENMRFKVDVTCDEKTLNECYLPHFKQSIEEGSAECVMTAYNKVNGTHCGENSQLMDIIRKQWGFEQVYTISDFVWGIRNGPASVKAGLDVEYPCPAIRAKTLPAALKRGDLDQNLIEKLGKRLLAAQLAYYSRLRDPAPSKAVICSESHRSIAHDTAVASMVLLKNMTKSGASLLPLDPSQCKKIVVVGALAASSQTGDAGSSNLKDPDVISPLQGLELAAHQVQVIYHSGKDITKAVKDAASANAVLFVTGFTGQHEGESVVSINGKINDICFHGPFSGNWLVKRLFGWIIWGVSRLGVPLGGDRRTLNLPPKDENLGLALADAAGNKMITVISASGAVILPKALREESAAILFSGYGGCRFGTALKDVLFGKAEPSGRLSFVMPESIDDLPDWDPTAEHVVYDRWWGYRLMQKKNKRPLYPFGFGLGYGQLLLVKDSLSSTTSLVERFISVSLKVQNKGKIASSAVVQIYAGRHGRRDQDDYERVLIGFQKQLVQPGWVQEVSVRCRLDPIAHFNTTTKKLEVVAGEYVIYGSQHEGDPDSETLPIVCENTFSI
jgi:beta-glucosidase